MLHHIVHCVWWTVCYFHNEIHQYVFSEKYRDWPKCCSNYCRYNRYLLYNRCFTRPLWKSGLKMNEFLKSRGNIFNVFNKILQTDTSASWKFRNYLLAFRCWFVYYYFFLTKSFFSEILVKFHIRKQLILLVGLFCLKQTNKNLKRIKQFKKEYVLLNVPPEK